jgi:hypothetical protein
MDEFHDQLPTLSDTRTADGADNRRTMRDIRAISRGVSTENSLRQVDPALRALSVAGIGSDVRWLSNGVDATDESG